jgi:hypothetical protein
MTRSEIIRELHRIREEHWAKIRHLSAPQRAVWTNEEGREIIKRLGLKVKIACSS